MEKQRRKEGGWESGKREGGRDRGGARMVWAEIWDAVEHGATINQ